MTWFKKNLIGLIIVLLLIIGFGILIFKKKDAPVQPIVIFNDSTENALRKENLELKLKEVQFESKQEVINEKNYYETKIYNSIPDSTVHDYNVELAKRFLSADSSRRYYNEHRE